MMRCASGSPTSALWESALRQSATGAVPSVLPAVRLAPVPWVGAGRVVDRREIAGSNSIRPALPAFLVGVARSLVDTTVVVADVLPSSSGRSLRTAVETFGSDDRLCAADTREPRTGVVRPAAAVALRLRVGGVRWRDCRLEPSWWCGCRGRPRRRALLLPVGSEYRLLICNVIRAAPMLRSGVLGRRGPGRDPLATMWDGGYDVTRTETV